MPDIPYPLQTDDFSEFRNQMLDIVRDIYENRIGGALEGDVFKVSGDVLELRIKDGSALKKVNGELDVDLSGASPGSAGLKVSLYNAKGVLLVGKAKNYPVALPASADGYILRVDHTTESGLAWGYTINGLTVTASTGTLTITNAKTLTVELDSVLNQDLTTDASPTFVTVKLSGLADGKIPYHVNDATGLADGPTKTDVDDAVTKKHAVGDSIASSISDGDTTHSPDGNSVFDALALKAPLANPTFTGTATTPALKVTTGAAAGNILISDADGDLSYLAAGATTKILVGGGAANPVWTEATGSGSPVRATSPTLVTPILGTPTSGTLTNCTGYPSASTTVSGVVELDTVAEVITGTDTSRATTSQGVAAAQAIVSNPKEMAQGVHLTASSTVGGLVVADDDDIDFGTGNCFFQADVSLPDFTPSATVYLFYKSQDATHRVLFYVSTSGYLVLDLNGTAYTSSATLTSVGVTDAYKAKMRADVTPGATNTTVDFSVNGYALGTQQTAANPGSLTNTGTLYLMGTSTTRHACTAYAFYAGNRVFTSAEIKSMAINSIDYADKWGSQTAVYTSDFSAGADSWTAGNGTATGNIDGIGGEDNTLRYYANNIPDPGTAHFLARTISMSNYKKYRASFRYYIPATNTHLDGIKLCSNAGGA